MILNKTIRFNFFINVFDSNRRRPITVKQKNNNKEKYYKRHKCKGTQLKKYSQIYNIERKEYGQKRQIYV
jgi:hypothetical protein